MSPPLGAVTNRLPFIAASLRCIISRLPVFVDLTCRQPPTKPLSRAALCGTIPSTHSEGSFSMLDIFEILGPIMVGPSSSHTAGAVRIGADGPDTAGRTAGEGGHRPVRLLCRDRPGPRHGPGAGGGSAGHEARRSADPRQPFRRRRRQGLHFTIRSRSSCGTPTPTRRCIDGARAPTARQT